MDLFYFWIMLKGLFFIEMETLQGTREVLNEFLQQLQILYFYFTIHFFGEIFVGRICQYIYFYILVQLTFSIPNDHIQILIS